MTVKEAFTTLGLPESATLEDVKRAYKELIQVWHPDRFSEESRMKQRANEKLGQINAAREVLFDFFQKGGWKSQDRREESANQRQRQEQAAPEQQTIYSVGVQYLGGDPRLDLSKIGFLNRKGAKMVVTPLGLLLVFDKENSIAYPGGQVVHVSSGNRLLIAPRLEISLDYYDSGAWCTSEDVVQLMVRDPEDILPAIVFKLRLVNSYAAKLLTKRIATCFCPVDGNVQGDRLRQQREREKVAEEKQASAERSRKEQEERRERVEAAEKLEAEQCGREIDRNRRAIFRYLVYRFYREHKVDLLRNEDRAKRAAARKQLEEQAAQLVQQLAADRKGTGVLTHPDTAQPIALAVSIGPYVEWRNEWELERAFAIAGMVFVGGLVCLLLVLILSSLSHDTSRREVEKNGSKVNVATAEAVQDSPKPSLPVASTPTPVRRPASNSSPAYLRLLDGSPRWSASRIIPRPVEVGMSVYCAEEKQYWTIESINKTTGDVLFSGGKGPASLRQLQYVEEWPIFSANVKLFHSKQQCETWSLSATRRY